MNDLAIGAESVLRGTIRVGSESYEYRSSFSSGLRFRCLPDCGLCCRTYRVPLTGFDLDRLKGVVDPRDCSTIVSAPGEEAAGIRAFMENGKAESCCYLDGNDRCAVYDNRPLYCRTYPLIRDTYAQLEMGVDYTCPGVGEGDPIETEQIEAAFRIEARQRPEALKVPEARANHRVICGSLKAMGVYADAELIRSVCTDLIERGLASRRVFQVSAYLKGAAAALAESLTGAGNITDPQAAVQIVASVENTFGSRTAETKESELSEKAAERLADYLEEWIRRQALLRFVHAAALARPGRLNVLHPFFAFLVDTACSILTDAEGLRSREGEQRITVRLMREAIRKNEGTLRSRCASVVSTDQIVMKPSDGGV
jgi:Fe-S-cluster containining protein